MTPLLSVVLSQIPTPTATPTEPLLDPDLPSSTDPCPNDGAVCNWFLEQTGSGWIAALLGEWLPKILTVLLVFIVAAILARIVRRLIQRVVTRTATESHDALRAITRRTSPLQDVRTVEHRSAVDARRIQRTETIASVLSSIAAFVIWMIAVFIALGQLGLNIAPLLAGAGIIGVALGFGSQTLVRDFLSGTFMILEDQYGVGDIVDVGEATGTVEAITLRVTRLRDVEGTVWHVPNGEITRVGNLSQLWSRSLLDIGVAYDTDLDFAGEVITRVANELAEEEGWNEAILEPPELWGVQQFGPNEVVLRLVMKVQPAAQWKVNREFRKRIKLAFDAEGIEIPFPQRTVWLREEGVPAAAGVPEAAMGSAPPTQEEGPSDDDARRDDEASGDAGDDEGEGHPA